MNKRYRVEVVWFDTILGNPCKKVVFRKTLERAIETAKEIKGWHEGNDPIKYVKTNITEYVFSRDIEIDF